MNLFGWSSETEDLKALCQSLMKQNSELHSLVKRMTKEKNREEKRRQEAGNSCDPAADPSASGELLAEEMPHPALTVEANDPNGLSPEAPAASPSPLVPIPEADTVTTEQEGSLPPNQSPFNPPVSSSSSSSSSVAAQPTPQDPHVALPVPSADELQRQVLALTAEKQALQEQTEALTQRLQLSQDTLKWHMTQLRKLELRLSQMELENLSLAEELETERLKHHPDQPKQRLKPLDSGEIPVWLK